MSPRSSAAPSRACSRAPPRRPWPSASAPRPGAACRAAVRGAPARAAACCSSPSGPTAASRPSSAAWIAQSGSVPWAQSEKRHWVASSSTSLNVSARPSDDSQSCSSRSPGVSTTSPPPGSRTSWRCRVVCRPSPSCSRIVCVASSSSPASVFTSVDLPTPDEPSSAIVRPGSEVGADQVEAVAGQARDRVDRHAERDRLDLEHLQRMVGVEIALRQHDHRLGAALPRHRHVPLQAAEVEVLVQRHDQEDGVDVGGEHLLLRGVQRDLARELRPAGDDGVDRRRVLLRPGRDRDPVADGRQLAGAGGFMRELAGGVRAELAELGVDDVGAAVLRGDARRDPALGGVRFEFGCVAVSPAEILQCVQASLLERDGRGRRAKSARAARLKDLPEVFADESLEPRSSEGEGGERSHVFEPPSSSGRVEVCLQPVTKSNFAWSSAADGLESRGVRPGRSRGRIFWGAGQT